MKNGKSIDVSTEIFARIWALRLPGEETEDDILRRLLPARGESQLAEKSQARFGFHDDRHGVSFEEGFEVFRTYRGKTFRARATGGVWKLEGRAAGLRSLNQLSRTIGAKTENAWQNWTYLNSQGLKRPLSDFRKHTQQQSGSNLDETEDEMRSRLTWRDDVVSALRSLSQKAPLAEIYKTVRKIRLAAGRSLPRSLEEVVRRTLEECCSDTESYKGVHDLFCMPEGKGAGVWALR